ncbi:hypothetical protein ACJX0J_031767, partial [Zea mays]
YNNKINYYNKPLINKYFVHKFIFKPSFIHVDAIHSYAESTQVKGEEIIMGGWALAGYKGFLSQAYLEDIIIHYVLMVYFFPFPTLAFLSWADLSLTDGVYYYNFSKK